MSAESRIAWCQDCRQCNPAAIWLLAAFRFYYAYVASENDKEDLEHHHPRIRTSNYSWIRPEHRASVPHEPRPSLLEGLAVEREFFLTGGLLYRQHVAPESAALRERTRHPCFA